MKLYVGNLAFSVTDAELENLFAQAGRVASARVIIDRETGKSRGFGFVEMSDRAEAEAAISQFNGMLLYGRTLKVNEARPQERSSHRNNGFGRSSSRR
ncbi:MAG: RNA-binding protein [Acidobacteriota bacterium]|nr:RNA-binding protein [Blastocatellia bacterium]MDW8411157.1 RNA-binding protein [Acidobacteriota bacterium]